MLTKIQKKVDFRRDHPKPDQKHIYIIPIWPIFPKLASFQFSTFFFEKIAFLTLPKLAIFFSDFLDSTVATYIIRTDSIRSPSGPAARINFTSTVILNPFSRNCAPGFAARHYHTTNIRLFNFCSNVRIYWFLHKNSKKDEN